MKHEPSKPFAPQSAPYLLGQIARTHGYSVRVNPYPAMGDVVGGLEFERGWNYEGGGLFNTERTTQPVDEAELERRRNEMVEKLAEKGL